MVFILEREGQMSKIHYLEMLKATEDGNDIKFERVESIPISWIEQQIEFEKKRAEHYMTKKGCEVMVSQAMNTAMYLQSIIAKYRESRKVKKNDEI